MTAATPVRNILTLSLFLFTIGCSSTPSNFFSAPKDLQLDGTHYLACSDVVWMYSPSRGVADSSKKTYEFTFTDEYGQEQDIKEVSSYTIRNASQATYAMPRPTPGTESTHYSNGTPFRVGEIVVFGEQGKGGRAKYVAPGQWEPVPCS